MLITNKAKQLSTTAHTTECLRTKFWYFASTQQWMPVLQSNKSRCLKKAFQVTFYTSCRHNCEKLVKIFSWRAKLLRIERWRFGCEIPWLNRLRLTFGTFCDDVSLIPSLNVCEKCVCEIEQLVIRRRLQLLFCSHWTRKSCEKIATFKSWKEEREKKSQNGRNLIRTEPPKRCVGGFKKQNEAKENKSLR